MNRRTLLSCLPFAGILPFFGIKNQSSKICVFSIINGINEIKKEYVNNIECFISLAEEKIISFAIDYDNQLLYVKTNKQIKVEKITDDSLIRMVCNHFQYHGHVGYLIFQYKKHYLTITKNLDLKLLADFCLFVNREIKIANEDIDKQYGEFAISFLRNAKPTDYHFTGKHLSNLK